MTIRKLLPFICLAVMAFSANAYAQLDSKGEAYSSKYWASHPNNNVISLIRKPELNKDQFILRITNPHAMNGCVDISNYNYSAEYKNTHLDVSIGDLTIDMRHQPQYAHFQCNQKTQIPRADIVLNRQDLISNQTNKIRMHNGSNTNYYDIQLSDNMVKILPGIQGSRTKRFNPQKIFGKKTSLLYWFYPLGTVIMWVPSAENDKDTAAKLRDFAKSKGLEPLETIYPSFESPLTNTQYQYFVDTAGHFTDNDPELINGKLVGNIIVDKIVYGLEKDEIELDEMAVYAKIPGMYE